MIERAPDSLPPLREVIRELGLSAKKSLGQNFILDLNLTGRIARSAGPLEGITVAEIGPGPGGLTRALLAEGAPRVIAVEKDVRCLPALAAIAAHYPDRLTVIEGDALDVEWPSLLPAGQKARIVANLPYSVATPLLIGWLKAEPWPPWWDRMVLMFQREVAERIVAQPGTKSYGRLAVLSQWRAETRILFHLPPRAFTPPPKVESAVVEFRARPVPLDAGGATMLERVTAAAFGQRRKMLRASLKGLSNAVSLLAELGIEPSERAEQLSVADFCRLSARIADPSGTSPAQSGSVPDVSDAGVPDEE
jgi:16S rRNA (adenine1518-N6/adenine1519-N6)-dimethyltransferase